jgi:hypothetical protein
MMEEHRAPFGLVSSIDASRDAASPNHRCSVCVFWRPGEPVGY